MIYKSFTCLSRGFQSSEDKDVVIFENSSWLNGRTKVDGLESNMLESGRSFY